MPVEKLHKYKQTKTPNNNSIQTLPGGYKCLKQSTENAEAFFPYLYSTM